MDQVVPRSPVGERRGPYELPGMKLDGCEPAARQVAVLRFQGPMALVAGIDWTCSQATSRWYPADDLRIYSEWLGDAVRVAGWSRPEPQVLASR